jgi:DNA-directed RNA polymerase subunit RPC12/RpoP
MDPYLIDFLLGVGIGFIEDEYITCPHCGGEFLEEELIYVDEKYACPACRRPLNDEDDDHG